MNGHIALLFGSVSAALAIAAYVPYTIDIVKGKAQPARATRVMLTIILIIALLQQRSVGSGWPMAVTIGELVGSIAILGLSMVRGIGGFKRHELICYGLLCIDIVIWMATDNAGLALHLSILADIIAFAPTIVKTWRRPDTETPLFYILGFVAPLLSVAAGMTLSYAIVVFPLYLAVINIVQLVVMYRPRKERCVH